MRLQDARSEKRGVVGMLRFKTARLNERRMPESRRDLPAHPPRSDDLHRAAPRPGTGGAPRLMAHRGRDVSAGKFHGSW
jgi:hypothetical protein